MANIVFFLIFGMLLKDGRGNPTSRPQISDVEISESQIKETADYENMCFTCSTILVSVDGNLKKYDTYEIGYIQSAIKVTKNYLGPKYEYLVETGLMKINSAPNKTALQTVDFSVFGAMASVHHSTTSAGYDAKLVLAGGSASIFDLTLGLGVSSQAGIVDDSLTLKVLGVGVQVGRKVGICVFDICFGVDFGRLG